MKKLWKTLLVAAVMSLTFCLFAGAGVFAEDTSDTGKEPDFTLDYDAETQTLVVTGDGEFTYEAKYHFSPDSDQLANEHLKKMVISDGVTAFDTTVLRRYDGVETLVIGKDVQKVDGYTGDYTFKVEISYEVDAENPNYASYNGLLYDKNFETLLAVPRKISNISYHSNVKAVGEFAYAFCEMNPVVIPWGVTQIGPQAFKGMTYGKVVLPDTVKDYGDLTYPAFEDAVDFICSEENQSINTILEGEYGTAMKTSILRQDISKYYPDRQVKSGWVQEGGKWYYYQNNVKTTGWQKVGPTWYYMDANGVMQTGWITLGGTKYLLRDWGGMAANGWYQIGGKWYYFNSWGGMEKNSWIYGLKKKWYYVGSDGAMLTNTRTPDGYRVDRNGVWVR